MLRPVLLPLLLLALNGPSAAQGLKLQPEAETPLRARVHLLSGDEYGQGTRLLGAQVLGDYFLGSRGLRVSGGLMLGPESLLASGDAQDRTQALALFARAARVGHRPAALRYAQCLRHGIGTDADPPRRWCGSARPPACSMPRSRWATCSTLAKGRR